MASGLWDMASGEWDIASGEWDMASGVWDMASREWDMALWYIARMVHGVRYSCLPDQITLIIGCRP